MRLNRQLDLPLGRKLQPDERALLERLREDGPRSQLAEVKRLMTPLPRITAFDA